MALTKWRLVPLRRPRGYVAGQRAGNGTDDVGHRTNDVDGRPRNIGGVSAPRPRPVLDGWSESGTSVMSNRLGCPARLLPLDGSSESAGSPAPAARIARRIERGFRHGRHASGTRALSRVRMCP